MSRPELEKILVKQRKEYERHIGTALESIEGQVRLVAESLGGLQTQLIAVRDMVAKNTEDIVKLQMQLIAVRDMVAGNTEDIETIMMDMHVVRSDLKERVGRQEFIALERRLTKLEKAVRRR